MNRPVPEFTAEHLSTLRRHGDGWGPRKVDRLSPVARELVDAGLLFWVWRPIVGGLVSITPAGATLVSAVDVALQAQTRKRRPS